MWIPRFLRADLVSLAIIEPEEESLHREKGLKEGTYQLFSTAKKKSQSRSRAQSNESWCQECQGWSGWVSRTLPYEGMEEAGGLLRESCCWIWFDGHSRSVPEFTTWLGVHCFSQPKMNKQTWFANSTQFQETRPGELVAATTQVTGQWEVRASQFTIHNSQSKGIRNVVDSGPNRWLEWGLAWLVGMV